MAASDAEKPFSDMDVDSDEENEVFVAPAVKTRKRLSVHRSTSDHDRSKNSVASSAAPANKPDVETLKKIYSTCIDLFQTQKITTENAFQLKFLDFIREIVEMPDFDKRDLVGSGRMLETGGKIYVCRVDQTKNSVMGLASTLNFEKRRKQEAAAAEQSKLDSDAEGMDMDDMEPSQRRDRKKKKKCRQKSHVVDPEKLQKISLPPEKEYTLGNSRRVELKQKFTDLLDSDVDFDYYSVIHALTKSLSCKTRHRFEMRTEEATKDMENPPTLGLDKFVFPTSFISTNEMKVFEPIRFSLSADYDPEIHDYWGNRKDEDFEANHLTLDECMNPPESNEYAYVPEENGPAVRMDLNASRQVNLDDGDYENGTFVLDDGNEMVEGTPPERQGKIISFGDFYSIYASMKSKLGWCGPGFIKQQHLNKKGSKPRIQKAPREPRFLKFKGLNLHEKSGKYTTDNVAKTLSDSRVIEKWGSKGRSVRPYIGIEDEDEEDIEFNAYDLSSKTFTSPSDIYIDNILSYYTFDKVKILKSDRRKEEEAADFEVPDADYNVEDAGFEVERQYDDPGFADDINDVIHDQEVPLTGSNPDFNGDMLQCLEGLLLDTEPISKSDTETIRFTKKPKPIDMHALKKVISNFLDNQLRLNSDGSPILEVETSVALVDLLKEVFAKVEKKMVEHLTISIIVAGLLHVVVEKKLFMVENPIESYNPRILCHGTRWIHKDNIPLPPNCLFDYANVNVENVKTNGNENDMEFEVSNVGSDGDNKV